MSIWEIFLIGVGLSMDAFAVSICKGLQMKKMNWNQAVVIALFFGGFQALMPLLGWLLGSRFGSSIDAVSPWVAFGLLAVIGGKMIVDALKSDEGEAEEAAGADVLDLKELTLMAVATSIDALAVGITFGMLRVHIGSAITLIGCTTFVIALGGVLVGNFFGAKFQRKAQVAGGVILILIGLKILLQYLGVVNF